MAPSEVTYFLRKREFLTQIFKYVWAEAIYYASESNKYVQKGCIFCVHYSLATLDEQLSQNFHRFVSERII